MSETESRSGCLKFLAFGCLAILAIGLVGSLAIGGLVFRSVGGESDWVQQNSTFDSAQQAALGLATEEQLADARTAVDLPTDNSLLGSATGSLTLDLAGASFELRAHDGDTIEVEKDYPEGRYTFSQETSIEDDGSEHTRIEFAPKGASSNNSGRNVLTILVPRTQRLALLGSVKQGESDLDIGGLTITEVDLDLAMGDHRLEASEPTLGLMESFSVRGRMGAVRLSRLGNASPYGVDVTHRMGEIRVNLEGDWRNDVAVSMRCSMGQCTADVPETVRADVDASAFMGGKSVRVEDAEDLAADAFNLRLRARATMGEVQVY